MSIISTPMTKSPWERLKKSEITCEEALQLLVQDENIDLPSLDIEVSTRFFRLFSNAQDIPPVIPLLLWRNCYYLGSPVVFTSDIIQKLSDAFGAA